MKQLSLHKGRIKQKLNTRSNILDAAKRLLDKNIDFSHDDVASEAGFSRATVYRYYSDIELLKLETLLDFQTKISIRDLEVMQGGSLTDSIFQIQDYFNKLAQNNEPTFRMYLSHVLKESVKPNQTRNLRGARRIKVLEEVLAPVTTETNMETIQKFIVIATLLMGIESLIVTRDVCNMNTAQSDEILKWGLEMVIQGMLHSTDGISLSQNYPAPAK